MTRRIRVKHYCYYEGAPDWSGGYIWAQSMTEAALVFDTDQLADPAFPAVVVKHIRSGATETIGVSQNDG